MKQHYVERLNDGSARRRARICLQMSSQFSIAQSRNKSESWKEVLTRQVRTLSMNTNNPSFRCSTSSTPRTPYLLSYSITIVMVSNVWLRRSSRILKRLKQGGN